MATEAAPRELVARRPFPARLGPKGSLLYKLITTTDHKLIGIMYMRRLLRVLLHWRPAGVVHARRARRTGAAVPVDRAIQPAVHHARHDHAAVLCHPDRVRVREPGAAAADRRTRRGVPPAQRPLILAVRVRRADRDRGVHHPGWGRGLRLDRLHAAVQCCPQSGRGRRPVDPGFGGRRPGHHPWCGQHDHHGGVPARTGDDDVPDADLHLEHPGHSASWC